VIGKEECRALLRSGGGRGGNVWIENQRMPSRQCIMGRKSEISKRKKQVANS